MAEKKKIEKKTALSSKRRYCRESHHAFSFMLLSICYESVGFINLVTTEIITTCYIQL